MRKLIGFIMLTPAIIIFGYLICTDPDIKYIASATGIMLYIAFIPFAIKLIGGEL